MLNEKIKVLKKIILEKEEEEFKAQLLNMGLSELKAELVILEAQAKEEAETPPIEG